MKNKMSRLFMAVMMVALLVSASIVNVSAADCEHTAGNEVTSTTLTKGTWYLGADITETITTTGDVTLCLNGYSITTTGTPFTLGAGTVTLCNCAGTGGTITGGADLAVGSGVTLEVNDGVHFDSAVREVSATAAVIQVTVGGELIMNGGSVSGNKVTASDGTYNGAIYINGGTVTLKGGEISNNVITFKGTKTTNVSAAIVMNNAESRLNINAGAVISGNTTTTSYHSGGAIAGKLGTITMTGGAISGNTAPNGGGITLWNGLSMTMSGGDIYSNTATDGKGGGVYLEEGDLSFTMTGGKIYLNVAGLKTGDPGDGGGVYVGPNTTFNMKGGSISGNYGRQTGGGVYNDGTFNLSGGTIGGASVPANNAGRGENTGNMSGTSKIGGGVMSLGTFTMSGGAITCNKSNGGQGGGIALYSGTFTMTDGSIAGNVAGTGHGMRVVDKQTAEITISGGKFGAEFGNADDPTSNLFEQSSEWLAEGYEVVESGDGTYTVEKPIPHVNCTEHCTDAGILFEAGTSALAGGKTYYLNRNVKSTVSNSITVSGKVTLCLNDWTLTAPDATLGNFITVSTGAELTICGGETGAGMIAGSGDQETRGIDVEESTLILESGTISGFTIASNHGGAVRVGRNPTSDPNPGTFYMNGGKITGNTANGSYGGAVYIYRQGTFIMDGDAEISGNTSTSTYTSVYNNGSFFTVENGTISGNIGGRSNAEVSVGGGSISGTITGVNLTITGGTFSFEPNDYVDETAYKVTNNNDGTWTVSGGTCPDHTGWTAIYASDDSVKAAGATKNYIVVAGTNEITKISTAGNYYLAEDLTDVTKCLNLAESVTLCLNGHSISSAVYYNNGVVRATSGGDVVLRNCQETGSITGSSGISPEGVGASTAVQGGDAKTLTICDGVTVNQGGARSAVRSNGSITVKIEGGYISGTLSEEVGSAITVTGGTFTNSPAAYLTDDTGMAEIEGVYYVGVEGFYTVGDGVHMDFGSSLALALCLNKMPNGEEYTITVTSPADGYKLDTPAVGVNGFYATGIAAKDMDEEITYTIKRGETDLFKKTVSIRDAAEQMHKGDESDFDIMLEDMINYGIAAQTAFGKPSMTELGKGTVDEPTWSPEDWTNTWDGEVAASLNLKEHIELNVYLQKDGLTKGKVLTDGDTQALDNNIIRVTFKDISVKEIKDYVAQLTVEEKTISYGVGNYVEAVIDAGGDQKGLMIALKKYVDSVFRNTAN